MNKFSGFESLVGNNKYKSIQSAHVMVIGLGGVGSWSVEALARSGVGKLTLVDFDDICVSNSNRQIHTLKGSYGKLKGQVLKERVMLINENCRVNFVQDFYTKSSSEEILSVQPDVIIDAIDSVDHKCLLITECVQRNIPLVVVGASAGKLKPHEVREADLNLSFNDRLLFRVRRKLRMDYMFSKQREPWGVSSVFSSENNDGKPPREVEHNRQAKGQACESFLGSACFVTGAFGFVAAAKAIELIK